MKNTAHSARQFVFCCVSTLLTALLAVLTFLRPERLPLAPLLVAMLLRPTLLLVTAGVNFSCLKMGVRALFSGKPDRHTAAVLTVLLALVLCALGVCPDASAAAALLLTASAWLDLLEQRDFEMVTAFRDKYIDLLRTYYFVGGMPAAVNAYLPSRA